MIIPVVIPAGTNVRNLSHGGWHTTSKVLIGNATVTESGAFFQVMVTNVVRRGQVHNAKLRWMLVRVEDVVRV